MIIGYSRVSTSQQDLRPQIEALKVAGALTVYAEFESGAKRDRPQLEIALASLQAGDILLTTKIDRLARSLIDFCLIVERVGKIGASYYSTGDGIDTKTPMGRAIMGVLAVFAELERTRILDRTREGRERAMARGVKFGNKFKLNPEQIAEAHRRREAGEPPGDIGRLFQVSRQTIMRATGEWQ